MLAFLKKFSKYRSCSAGFRSSFVIGQKQKMYIVIELEYYLGHVIKQTEAAYQRDDLLEKDLIMQDWLNTLWHINR